MNTLFTQKGFVVLYTVLVSSVVLLIAIGISNISSKELALSATAKDGYKAFYAADAGIECALYHDRQLDVFAASGTPSIDCFGTTISASSESLDDGTGLKFTINFAEESDVIPCTSITIEKYVDFGDGVANGTRIEARGYNTCNTGNTRRVERAIRVLYQGLAAPAPDGGGDIIPPVE